MTNIVVVLFAIAIVVVVVVLHVYAFDSCGNLFVLLEAGNLPRPVSY